MKPFSRFLVIALFALGVQAHGAAPRGNPSSATTRTEAVTKIKGWRDRLIEQDQRASAEQKKQVSELALLSLKRDLSQPQALSIADRELNSPLDAITDMDNERVEIANRIKIVDQLIFAVDTKWSGADLRGFLETQLLDLAVNDISEPGQGIWWKFLIQASIGLREISEPGSDPIKFLEAYMAESGVLEPKSVLVIMKSLRYIGG